MHLPVSETNDTNAAEAVVHLPVSETNYSNAAEAAKNEDWTEMKRFVKDGCNVEEMFVSRMACILVIVF